MCNAPVVNGRCCPTTSRPIQRSTVNGRKRHLVVDSQGFMIGVVVTEVNASERSGAVVVLEKEKEKLSRLEVIWVDHYLDDVMETACGLHNFRLTHRAKKGSPLCQAA